MWRFKASKYKNAAPKIPKHEEWITDLNVGNLLPSCGNHIKASAVFMAFNTESAGGGNLCVLPVNDKGRRRGAPVLQAHANFVTDFDFNPFNDYNLATCSQDCTVKIWSLPEGGLEGVFSTADMILTQEEKRVENVLWHPSADATLAVTSHKTLKVFDVKEKQAVTDIEVHKDQVQSVSWKEDGSTIVTSGKDKMIKIVDPRAGNIVQEAEGHQNIKDSRVMWIGNKELILSTGFDKMRTREITLRDVRNLKSSLKTINVDTSTGAMIPLYDSDTGMLLMAGKGDTAIRYVEVTDDNLIENACDMVEQIRGMGLVPKRALDVMSCEVNRVLLLTQHAVIPVSYCVPRKTYSEFHGDLYPETACGEPSMTSQEWFKGANTPVRRMSLDPAERSAKQKPTGYTGSISITPVIPTAADEPVPKHESKPTTSKPAMVSQSKTEVHTVKAPTPERTSTNVTRLAKSFQSAEVASPPPKPQTPVIQQIKETSPAARDSSKCTPDVTQVSEPDECVSSPRVADLKKSFQMSPETSEPASESKPVTMKEKSPRVFAGVRHSKFRHMKALVLHKQHHIENLRNISKVMPGESDMFHANKDRCAVPLGGAGGLIAVLELSKPGRLPDTGVPAVQNGAAVMDFVFDPFDHHRLVAACDNAKILVWRIPDGGLTETLTEPEAELLGHTEKIYFVRFHPLAKDVLATASYDMSVRIWDLATWEEVIKLDGHTDTIFSLGWSPDGKKCVTVCKDGRMRLYDPRSSTSPIAEGVGPAGARGARVIFVRDGQFIATTGFSRSSDRQITLYNPANLTTPLHRIDLGVSPSILVPYFDEDSSTLFATGRGDSSVFAYEIAEDAPYLFPLSTYTGDGLHQAICFLHKRDCDVRQVEFAKAWKLTSHSVEPVSFTVPRVKSQYFQDDLFPDTRVTWKPLMTSKEWFSGVNRLPQYISLQPKDMKLLSDAPVEAPKPRKYESYKRETFKTDEMRKEELLSAMSGKLDLNSGPLPQDLTEGVDEDEWDD